MNIETRNHMNGIDVKALKETVTTLKEQPELALVSFNVHSEWLDGCHQSARTGDVTQNGAIVEDRTATFTFESDEPAALLGSDKAASPGEYVLQALAGCYAVTFAANAAARGIELESLKFDLRVGFDLQGFLGIDRQTRAGAQQIDVTVHAPSQNASRAELEELVSLVESRSPIRDTLANPVSVHTHLA